MVRILTESHNFNANAQVAERMRVHEIAQDAFSMILREHDDTGIVEHVFHDRKVDIKELRLRAGVDCAKYLDEVASAAQRIIGAPVAQNLLSARPDDDRTRLLKRLEVAIEHDRANVVARQPKGKR